MRAWALKLARFSSDLFRRYIVSSLERWRFSARICGVMKGLSVRELTLKDLRGACLSRMLQMVELRRVRNVSGVEGGGDVYKGY